MSHQCVWRYRYVWKDELSTDDWQRENRYRVQVCAECKAEQNAKVQKQRRRYRQHKAPLAPTKLRKILPAKQWATIDKILAKIGGNRLQLDALLAEWLHNGWITVEEHQQSNQSHWQINKVKLSPAAYQQLIALPQAKRTSQQKVELAATRACLSGWAKDVAQAKLLWANDPTRLSLIERLANLLETQESALERGEWLPLPDTKQQVGGAVHKRWLRILRGVVALFATRESMYERTFSVQWLEDSKALARERKALAGYLGIQLEQLGLYRHTPVAYCWGAFTARCHDYPVDGQAGEPFIALSSETIHLLKDIQIDASAILVIENQTAFETLLRAPLRQDKILYLFSAGHAGYAERALLSIWLRITPNLPWYMWSDFDVGGIRIQADWAQWAKQQRLSAPIAWLWDADSLTHWKPWGQPLSEKSKSNLEALQHPLAKRLLAASYTLEQEALLTELTEPLLLFLLQNH